VNVSKGDLAIVIGNVLKAAGNVCTVVSYEGEILHGQLKVVFKDCWLCHFQNAQSTVSAGKHLHEILIPDEFLRKIAGPDLKKEIEKEMIKEKPKQQTREYYE
jgi:hypothetical protein